MRLIGSNPLALTGATRTDSLPTKPRSALPFGCHGIQKETGGKVRVWLFGWVGAKAQFLADVKLAERLKAPQLLLWESDYVGLPPASQEAVQAMHDYANK